MKFFYSPMKLMELIKEKDAIPDKLKENDADWYFSKDGENAYKNAKTPAQKTMYFFQYLLAIAKTPSARDLWYKVAYVMANSMDNSSLEFAGYPNILDSAKNPLVNYVKRQVFQSEDLKDPVVNGIMLLAQLHHEVEPKKFLAEELKPYSRITYCETDGSLSDMYKIERDIIGAFCADYSGQYMPPYKYNIVKSSKEDANENTEGV